MEYVSNVINHQLPERRDFLSMVQFISFSSVQCSAVQCGATYSAVRYNTMQCAHAHARTLQSNLY
jgi:hypothetical protein